MTILQKSHIVYDAEAEAGSTPSVPQDTPLEGQGNETDPDVDGDVDIDGDDEDASQEGESDDIDLPEIDDEDIDVPGLPGQPQQPADPAREAEYLRQVVQRLSHQNQSIQRRLDEYEMAGLDDDERQLTAAQRQAQQYQQQLREAQDQAARGQWYQYYSQFVGPEVIQGENPVDWQHSTMSHLYKENHKLYKQVEAYKTALANRKKNPVPQVTPKGSGPASVKTFDQMSIEELEAAKERALWGDLDWNTMPQE